MNRNMALVQMSQNSFINRLNYRISQWFLLSGGNRRLLCNQQSYTGTLGIIILFGYTKNLSAYHFRYLKHNLGQTLRVVLGINIFYIILLFPRCLSITNIIDIKAKGFGQVVKPVNFQLIFQSDLTPLIIIFYIKKLRYSSLCPVHPEKKQQLTTNEPLCCGTVENAASTVIADLGISPS